MTIFQNRCPSCGQTIKGCMFGIYFTPGRYRILKMIADNPGLNLEALRERLYPNRGYSGWKVICSTITKINELLCETDYRIKGPGQGHLDGGYRLIDAKNETVSRKRIKSLVDSMGTSAST